MITEQHEKSVMDYTAELSGLSLSEQADFWVIQLDNPMSDNQEMAFRLWLQANPAHRAAYDEARQIWALATDAAATYSRDNQPKPAGTIKPNKLRVASLTVALVLILLTGLFFLQIPLRPAGTLQTAYNSFRDIELADGSHAVLDAGSEIRINYSANERVVRLKEGGVFVDVTPNKSRPFIVSVNQFDVRAVGTAYSVELLQGNLDVSVHEGVIEILDPHHATQAPIRLQEGQSWSFNMGSNTAEVRENISVAHAYWRKGQLKSEDQPLGEILEKLSRHIGENVLWINPEIQAIKVSGLFQLDNSNFLLDVLLKKYGIEKYELFGKSVFFLKKS